jgi:hypothetical protein
MNIVDFFYDFIGILLMKIKENKANKGVTNKEIKGSGNNDNFIPLATYQPT